MVGGRVASRREGERAAVRSSTLQASGMLAPKQECRSFSKQDRLRLIYSICAYSFQAARFVH